MNIFVLDTDTTRCARYHCDRHVVKMILESVQMMCTVLSKKGIATPYKPTHHNHPCVRWVEDSYDNFVWLKKLAIALNSEYRYRFQKTRDHKSIAVLKEISDQSYETRGLTAFVQAMPEKYRVPDDPVLAYRQFYLGEKMHFAKWTRRQTPHWVFDREPS